MISPLRWWRERRELDGVPAVTQAFAWTLTVEGRQLIEQEARRLRRMLGSDEN